jgi:integrase
LRLSPADTVKVATVSPPALAILDKMRDSSEGELIFPNPDDGAFSENAMLAVLDRLGYGHVTVHGFRSTFATWAEECTDYPDGVREAARAIQPVGLVAQK